MSINMPACHLCGRMFTKVSNLTRHLTRKTPCNAAKSEPTCDICHRIFDRQSTLDRHMSKCRVNQTADSTKHICPKCRREFTRKDSTARHLKVCKFVPVSESKAGPVVDPNTKVSVVYNISEDRITNAIERLYQGIPSLTNILTEAPVGQAELIRTFVLQFIAETLPVGTMFYDNSRRVAVPNESGTKESRQTDRFIHDYKQAAAVGLGRAIPRLIADVRPCTEYYQRELPDASVPPKLLVQHIEVVGVLPETSETKYVMPELYCGRVLKWLTPDYLDNPAQHNSTLRIKIVWLYNRRRLSSKPAAAENLARVAALVPLSDVVGWAVNPANTLLQAKLIIARALALLFCPGNQPPAETILEHVSEIFLVL